MEDNWVDVSEKWTRAEFRALTKAEGAEFWRIWNEKVSGCHLETAPKAWCDNPAAIDEDSLDDMDLRLLGFVGAVMVNAGVHLRSLGNARARLSSNGAEQN